MKKSGVGQILSVEDLELRNNAELVLLQMPQMLIVTNKGNKWVGRKFKSKRALFVVDSQEEAIEKTKKFKFHNQIFIKTGPYDYRIIPSFNAV